MEAHVPNEFLCLPNFKTNPNAWGIWFQLVLMARANKGKGEHWFKKPGEKFGVISGEKLAHMVYSGDCNSSTIQSSIWDYIHVYTGWWFGT